jgi:protein-tyrosine phosphatase
MKLDADPIAKLRGGGALWQGSVPPEGAAVRRAGFHVLVLCAEEHQPHPSTFDGITVVHAPNDDCHAPTREQLAIALRAAREVVRHVRAGRNVLVTCQMGWNRSGLVSALAVRDLLRCSGAKAVERVRKKRRNALGNRAFARIVTALEAP